MNEIFNIVNNAKMITPDQQRLAQIMAMSDYEVEQLVYRYSKPYQRMSDRELEQRINRESVVKTDAVMRAIANEDYKRYVASKQANSAPYQFTCTQMALKKSLGALPKTKIQKYHPELFMSLALVIKDGIASLGRYNTVSDCYELSELCETDNAPFVGVFIGDALEKFVKLERHAFTFSFYANRVVVECARQRINFKALDNRYYLDRQTKVK